MARALECPACGHRHRLDTIPASTTFRCEQCGQVLKVPAAVSSQPDAPPPPARGGGAPTRTGAPVPVAPPPRRTENAPPQTSPDDDGATRGAPVRTAAAVSATVAATSSPDDSDRAGDGPRRGRTKPSQSAPAPVPEKRTKVHWYWRVLAWIVAVPVGFLLTAWPAYKLGFIKKDDLLDLFVGTGTGRYLRLAIVTLVWAIVTALLVQLFVEGGRARANRRRRSRAAAA
jgi:hypothetical protein